MQLKSGFAKNTESHHRLSVLGIQNNVLYLCPISAPTGVGHLAAQTIEYSQYVQTKIMMKLERGHMLDYLMSFMSFISRVW